MCIPRFHLHVVSVLKEAIEHIQNQIPSSSTGSTANTTGSTANTTSASTPSQSQQETFNQVVQRDFR
jgi:hypothetical protein